ncbi:MAG TPA: adenosylcobinamide-GDP ribazoletransferase [Nitrospira sp.]
MTASMRPLLFAWQFLTAVPLSRDHHEPAADELADSMYWYPFVGMLLGGLLAAFDLALSHWMPREVVSALVIVLLITLTRGLHQDGLADTLDGLAGGRNPTDRLAIMRDPHIGAIGATGLFVALIVRYAALVSLPDAMRFVALLCMPAIGRWAMVVGAYKATYARSEGGLGAPFLLHLRIRHVVGSTIVVGCLVMWAFGLVRGATILLIGAAFIRLMTIFCHRFFAGVTGDTLGAMNEIVEIMFLLSIPFLESHG